MTELKEIKLDPFSKNTFKEYKKLNPNTHRSILAIRKKIKQKTIIHINSTPYGGGVAEILKSQVPIEKLLGLKSRWLTMKAPAKFFRVTKKIHNLLQGKPGFLSEEEKKFYLSVNHELEKQLGQFLKRFENGIVVIHDPQPLPLIRAIPENFSSFLRFHLDFSGPNPSTLEFLRPFIVDYNLIILSNKDYLPAFPWIKKSKLKIIYPAFDHLSEKNRFINKDIAKEIILEQGINPLKPIVAQVSRFDSWKDPLGVIRAYYLAKNKIPDLKLVLVGFFETQDDPEQILVFEQVKKHVKGDPDIYLFSSRKQLKNISIPLFINALRTLNRIILQGSIREGFGLTITEGMWKGQPVIARISSGALIQIKNGENGILVASPEEMGKAIVRLLKNEKLCVKIGKAAQASVRKNFLMPRFILDNLKLYFPSSSKTKSS